MHQVHKVSRTNWISVNYDRKFVDDTKSLEAKKMTGSERDGRMCDTMEIPLFKTVARTLVTKMNSC